MDVVAQRPRVLVVDDEPTIGRVIKRLLGATCDVAVEACGADALRRIHDGARFDLLLLDVHTPGMDGAAVHAALLRVAPEQAARVVFLTGDPGDEALASAPRATLPKPFDAAALRALVRARTAP